MLRAMTSIGASCSIGDVACQLLQESKMPYEPQRTAAFAAAGFIVLGPVSYAILTSATAIIPGSSTAAIAKRILLISALEPLRLGIFLPSTVIFQGDLSTEIAIEKMKAETLPASLKSWMVFTAPLFIGFRYLKPENRVPLLSCVGACWNTYLSWLSHRRQKS